MLAAHEIVGVLVLVVTSLAVIFGGYAFWSGRAVGGLVRQLLGLAQTLLIAQVALGLLLLSEDRRVADDLHYLYGTLALAAVLAPWLYAPPDPRRRLAWFVGATLLAGLLSVRAYTTAR